jgi:hypothetical protein
MQNMDHMDEATASEEGSGRKVFVLLVSHLKDLWTACLLGRKGEVVLVIEI